MTLQNEQVAHKDLIDGGETTLHSHQGGGGVGGLWILDGGKASLLCGEARLSYLDGGRAKLNSLDGGEAGSF